MRKLLPFLAFMFVLTGCGAAGTFTGQQDAPPPGKCLVIRASDGVGISCNYGNGH